MEIVVLPICSSLQSNTPSYFADSGGKRIEPIGKPIRVREELTRWRHNKSAPGRLCSFSSQINRGLASSRSTRHPNSQPMAGSSRYIPLEDEDEDEDVDYENCDPENPLGLPKYCSREERRRNNRKTRIKTIQVPQHQIDLVLGYKGIPAAVQACADSDPSTAALIREAHECVLARQKIIRQQLEANGCATYEADSEEEEEEEDREEEGATAPDRGAPRGGRRRFRPGVMKHAEGVKKLN